MILSKKKYYLLMKLLKSLAVNIFLILLVLYLLSWVGAFLLNNYTRHGESLTLPNLKGLSFEEVEKILAQKKLRYIITDTAFIDSMPKGSVVEQNPSENTKVKEGRFIYITINSNSSYITNREYPYYQYVYGSGSGGRLVTSAAAIDPITGLPSVAGITNYRAYGALMLGQDILGYTGTPSKYLPKPNNIKELYQMGVVTTNSVAIDKGGDLGSFRLSFANTSGDHVMENLEVQKKNNLTFRGSQKISKSLTTDISVLYTNNKVKNRTYQKERRVTRLRNSRRK